MSKLTIYKQFQMECSHRLCNPNMPEDWNKETFGKCYNPPGHGHTYFLTVGVEGEQDKDSGMVLNFSTLKEIVNREIVEEFDHHFINDIPHFGDKTTTAENMVDYIWDKLEGKLQSETYQLKEVVLHETPTSWVKKEK